MRTVAETTLLQETLRSFFMRVNGWNGERYDARAYALAREVTKIFQEAEHTTTDQPPLPPDTLCESEVPGKAASYARLAGICRRINWHNVGDPAMDNDHTKHAMIELTAWLFNDCGIEIPFSAGPAPDAGAENSLLRIAVAGIIEPRHFLPPNQQPHDHGTFDDDPSMPSRASVNRKADEIIALISGYTLPGGQPGLQARVGLPARAPEPSSVADPDPAPPPNWLTRAVDSAAVTIAATGKRQPDGSLLDPRLHEALQRYLEATYKRATGAKINLVPKPCPTASATEISGDIPALRSLEWRDHPNGGLQADASGLSLYRIHSNGSDWYLDTTHMGIGGRPAAQADHDRRVRDRILPTAAHPTDELVDAAVAFAQSVQLSSDYNWQAYMRDLWKIMLGETGAMHSPTATKKSPAPMEEHTPDVSQPPAASTRIRIRQLAWTRTKTRGNISLLIEAHSPIGLYQIRRAVQQSYYADGPCSPHQYLARTPEGLIRNPFPSEDAAMAACQADFQQRAEACFEPSEPV